LVLVRAFAGDVVLLGTSNHALLGGWDAEGRVTEICVSAAGRAMLSQLYSAKTNGYRVQVTNDGLNNIAGVRRVNRLLVQQ
jgi:hypothetical protein